MVKRLVGVVIVLGIGAALGIGLLRVADRGDRQARPGTFAGETPSPSPSATAEPEEATYLITTQSACLRIRERPSLNARVLDCIATGSHLTGDGRVRRGDGMRWAHVRTPRLRLNGWSSLTFLERIDDQDGEGEPTDEPSPGG